MLTKNKRVKIITKKLISLFPSGAIELQYNNVWELLVAVILSAQTTDNIVNKVTDRLFGKYTNLNDYINADIFEFEKDIYPTGFYHTKAKHIIECAHIIKNKYDEQIPSTMEELLKLPGVGRKTANIVLTQGYGIVSGIAVDTHVKRLSRIWGLTESKDQQKIEKDLMKLLPKSEWAGFSYRTIAYGRAYCKAKFHNHAICPLTELLQR
ncbi:MAG: endonuclease III [Patescibacteria group bacterium]